MKAEIIHPAENLSGQLELPGDKSISHRYAMIAALADGTSELRNFAKALRKDWAAATARLTVPYSSGPVEGHVNRINMIKRQMYGRAKPDLLRKRVLLAD